MDQSVILVLTNESKSVLDARTWCMRGLKEAARASFVMVAGEIVCVQGGTVIRGGSFLGRAVMRLS